MVRAILKHDFISVMTSPGQPSQTLTAPLNPYMAQGLATPPGLAVLALS
jgi:hypothetical protein